MAEKEIKRWITVNGSHIPIYDDDESSFVDGLTGASKTVLNNKGALIDYVKDQTGVDMSKYAEPKVARSRTYFGVHLEDMPTNDRNSVIRALKSYGHDIQIGDNGGYGSAIYYEK